MSDLTCDLRREKDRRTRPTPMFSRYTLCKGMRRGDRRAGAVRDTFVDRHGTGLFLLVMAIVALNILDAFFTVYLISHGGTELNPLVHRVLEGGTVQFVLSKTLCTGLCITILSMTKNFLIARIGLTSIASGYTALLAWHLYLASSLGSA